MQIEYNYLNLPERITIDGNKVIEIIYDASGVKQAKQLTEDGTALPTKHYCSGIEYNTTTIEAIYHAEGRAYNLHVNDASITTLDLRYEYTLTDHLGNARVTFYNNNGQARILQENHYYSFGMAMNGSWKDTPTAGNKNPYLYNGKELNEDFGLNWYAYGARYYDAAIGRFTGVDPIADDFPWVSTYNYAENEPIANIDLHGLQKLPFGEADYYRKLESQWNFMKANAGPTTKQALK